MMIGIKYILHFLLILFVSIFLASCEKNLIESNNNSQSEPKPEELIYSNSFESPEDTMGWYGYADYWFFPEACPGGGLQSLYVSGGCVGPHAVFTLSPLTENSDLIFRFWARSLERSSIVGLFLLTGQRPKPGVAI
jgi:hypothetical protein